MAHAEIPFRPRGEYPGLVVRCRLDFATTNWMHGATFKSIDAIHWAGCYRCGAIGPMAPGERPHCLSHCDQAHELGGGSSWEYCSFLPQALQDAIWAAYRLDAINGAHGVVDGLCWSLERNRWETYL